MMKHVIFMLHDRARRGMRTMRWADEVPTILDSHHLQGFGYHHESECENWRRSTFRR